MTFFRETEKLTLKFLGNHKRFQFIKQILNKKKKARGSMFLDFKKHYKGIVIKTV
jgi:hypothetical protein